MPKMRQQHHPAHHTHNTTGMYETFPETNTNGEDTTMNLLDIIAATEARDTAIARAATATDTTWKTNVWAVIERFATGDEFTTDTIWQACADEGIGTPREPRAMGAIMVEAARSGLVAATDRYVRSQRVACHARPIRVWRKV